MQASDTSEQTRAAAFQWGDVLAKDADRWTAARMASQGGPRVLVANASGINTALAFIESTLAVSLTLRGAEVHVLLCDEALPACQVSQIERVTAEEFVRDGPSRSLCADCARVTSGVFQPLGLRIHRYSELISPEDRLRARDLAASLPIAEIRDYRLDGLHVGEHAHSGALRFFARGELQGEAEGEAALRRYFSAAVLSVWATRRLMTELSFTCVYAVCGIYVPEGLIGEVARARDVRVANWSIAYRNRNVIFSHGHTYHHTLLSEPTAVWENAAWTPEMEAEIVGYLNSRRYGTRDWIRFIDNPQEDLGAIAAELGVDFRQPCVGLLTNVFWDAQVHYAGNAFENMLVWLVETIRYFERRPDLQLIIRVHPGEILAETRARQTVTDEIRRFFPNLPRNVFVIPPESAISTYAVMAQCNAVVIYGTKTGVELTSMGIPVIVAGEAWIRNKGITMDASSPEEYFRLLDGLPLGNRLSEQEILRARKYAYHFFFRRMIPLPMMMSARGALEPDVQSLDDLVPGRHLGLDVICNGILHGSEFAYPAENQVPVSDTETPTSGRSRAELRVIDGLAYLGEFERMRACLLRVLVDSPWVTEETWARESIAGSVRKLVLTSETPAADTRALLTQFRSVASTINGHHTSQRESGIRRLSGDIWREVAVGGWKQRYYRLAGYAALQAMYRDPAQLFRPALWNRLMGAFLQTSLASRSHT